MLLSSHPLTRSSPFSMGTSIPSGMVWHGAETRCPTMATESPLFTCWVFLLKERLNQRFSLVLFSSFSAPDRHSGAVGVDGHAQIRREHKMITRNKVAAAIAV